MLELNSISLIFDSLNLTRSNVQLIQTLLRLDVRVESLSLPTSTNGNPDGEWQSTWASLLLTVCGHSKAKIQPTYPIEELRVGFMCGREHMERQFQALFSVIVHATAAKKLTLTDRQVGPAISSLWRWFVYALFSRAYMTSVESVDTSGSSTSILWHNPDVDVASVVNAVYPETQLFPEATAVQDHSIVIAS